MLSRVRSIFTALLLCLGRDALAECEAVFPSGVSSNSPTGNIFLNYYATVNGGSNGRLTTTQLSAAGARCDNRSCSASNDVAQTLSPPDPFTGTQYLRLGFLLTGSLPPGQYGGIELGVFSTLLLTAGDYYFNGPITTQSFSDIRVVGSGTVRIYSSSSINFNAYTDINPQGDPGQMLIYGAGSVSVASYVEGRALIYTPQNITFNSGATWDGGVSAGGRAQVDSYAVVTFNPADLSQMDYGGACTAAGPTLGRLEVSVGALASVCVAQPVTITAFDSLGNVFDDYTGTVELFSSRGHGVFASGPDAAGTLAELPADDGAASYTFAAADNGQITLSFSNQLAETTTLTATDVDAAVAGQSAAVTFSENALVVTTVDSLGADVVAGRDHDFELALYRRDAAGDCGIVDSYDPPSLKASITRSAADPNGIAPSIDSQNLNSAPTAMPVAFEAGIARWSLATADVGQYSIEWLDDSLAYSDTPLTGASPSSPCGPSGSASGFRPTLPPLRRRAPLSCRRGRALRCRWTPWAGLRPPMQMTTAPPMATAAARPSISRPTPACRVLAERALPPAPRSRRSW